MDFLEDFFYLVECSEFAFNPAALKLEMVDGITTKSISIPLTEKYRVGLGIAFEICKIVFSFLW